MSLNAAALEILVAKGLSGDDLIAVARALESSAHRSPAARRQANYRERGGGKISNEMRTAIFERDGWACLDCGATDYLCCDHIVPVSKGGETSLDNLQTLCRPCNSKKKDRVRKRDRARISGGSSSGSSADPPPNDRDILTPSIPIANAIADPEKVLFDSGVELLKAGGTADGKARSLLGKWKRDHGVATVIEALSTAKREGAIEPISFIEATLRTKAKQQAPPVWDGMA